MINILLAVDDGDLTALDGLFQRTVLNKREGRLLVDAVGEYNDIGDAMRALTAAGRNPTPIGGWKRNGEPLAYYPLNLTQWLAVAPDVWDMTDPDNPVPMRPTAFIEGHRWAGWGEKQI